MLWRDIPILIAISVLILAPFFLVHGANFFGKEGFVDRFGALSSTLTGFYVAALVAAATFATENGALDKPIEVGPVMFRPKPGEVTQKLTRRQYVCVMFGYLSFISFALSIASIIFVVIAAPVSVRLPLLVDSFHLPGSLISRALADAVMFIFTLFTAHLAITTCYGLYYLVDRLYAKAPILLPRNDGQG